MREHYDVDGHGVELVEIGGGWQILTRAEYTEAIERAQLAARPARLSGAALETLAIIAYRQPIGRAEIEEIRGVAVGSVLKSLHERGLIDVVGRGEGLGRPLLYGTTPIFLEHFALRHLEELPRADELAIALRAPPREREAGVEAAIARDVPSRCASSARSRAPGVASRRKAEELVAAGRVTVNGDVAQIGQSVDPDRATSSSSTASRIGAPRADRVVRAQQAGRRHDARGPIPKAARPCSTSCRASGPDLRRSARLPDRRRAPAHHRRRRRRTSDAPEPRGRAHVRRHGRRRRR